jgi:hypothetical protein
MTPVMSKLSEINNLCVGWCQKPVWLGNEVIMQDSVGIPHAIVRLPGDFTLSFRTQKRVYILMQYVVPGQLYLALHIKVYGCIT